MALVAMFSLSACDDAAVGAEPPAKPAQVELPPPLEPVGLSLEPRVPSTGRVLTFDLTVPAGYPPLLDVCAKLGARSAIVAPWDKAGRLFKGIAPVDIEETQRALDLVVEARFADGSPLSLRRRIEIADGVYDESKLRVKKRFVEPSRAQRRRAEREKADIARVLESPAPERLWRGSFARPVPTEVTAVYGTKRTYNDQTSSRHLGLDLDGRTGDPIVAAQRGRAVLVQDRYYSGRTVVLDHGQGLFTLYFHMSAFDVEQGAMVEKGQLIGKVGRTGRVTGPHLHFSVKIDGLYVDPETILGLSLDDDPAMVGQESAVAPASEAIDPSAQSERRGK